MKYILLLALISFPGISQAQDFAALAKKIEHNCHSVTSIEKLIQHLPDEDSFFRISRYLGNNRINYFELEEVHYRVGYFNKPGGQNHSMMYDLDMVIKNDSILHLSFERSTAYYRSDEIVYPQIRYTDSLFAISIVKRFNNTFNTNHDWRELLTETGNDIYGLTWGLGNFDLNTPILRIFDMVKRVDVEGLKRLCLSSCNETSAYGATGIFLLKQIGKGDLCLDETLDEIRLSGRTVNFAPGGCVILGGTPIAEALSDEFLAQVAEVYKSYHAKRR